MKDKIKRNIIALLNDEEYSPLHFSEVANIFSSELYGRDKVVSTLNYLINENIIGQDKEGKLFIVGNTGDGEGIISINSKGFGFVLQEDGDIFIAKNDLNGSMNGDLVKYKLYQEKNGAKREGKVISILARANKIVAGRFQKSKNFGFVVPNDTRIQDDIFIPRKYFNGASNNDIVVCEIISYPEKGKRPEARIINTFGKKQNLASDIEIEVITKNIEREFPSSVKNATDKIKENIDKSEILGRKDFRDKLIYTIDGRDSKDFDDAISVELNDKGNYLLGVHIADVTHYVKENSPLDKEALKRGTSVYFANDVIPMLPRKLSNGICSLNPNEDRLVLSLEVELNKDAKVISYDISEGIIESKYRLVYDDVSDYLESKSGILDDADDKALLESLKLANDLSSKIRNRRKQKGSIDFNSTEKHFIIARNEVEDVLKREIRVANKIIEDFMILANEIIAEHFSLLEIPFIYRNHEEPNKEKLELILDIFNSYDINIFKRQNEKIYSTDIQRMIESIKGYPEEEMINYELLRAMQKAKYSKLNKGHFGLALKNYTHFTSPIRRYPDLQIHRIIKEFLKGNLNSARYNHYNKILDEIADKNSKSEIKAIELERAVEDILSCYYMKNHKNEIFNGRVTNITKNGLVIILDNFIKGFCYIPEEVLTNFRIGQDISVVVDKIDFLKKEIIFLTDI